MAKPLYQIRERERRGRPHEAYGEHVSWTEYQVVDGRRIVGRFDLREQAQRWIDQNTGAAAR